MPAVTVTGAPDIHAQESVQGYVRIVNPEPNIDYSSCWKDPIVESATKGTFDGQAGIQATFVITATWDQQQKVYKCVTALHQTATISWVAGKNAK